MKLPALQKKPKTDIDDLARIFADVPRIDDRPKLVENSRELAKHQQRLAELEKQRRDFYSGPPTPTARAPGREADAQRVLNDLPLEGQTKDSRLAELKRLIEAEKAAVTILENERKNICGSEIRAACAGLPGTVTQIFLDVIERAEELDKAIAAAILVSQELDSKGLESTRRPLYLQVCPYSFPGKSRPVLIYASILFPS